MPHHHASRSAGIAFIFAFVLGSPILASEPSRIEAVSGSPEELFQQGRAFLSGEGVAKDEKHALELFRRAANNGHAEAIAMLGYFYSIGLVVEKDDTAARRYFETAAGKGSASAQLNLGIFLLKGRGGEKDPEGGILSIQKAVAQRSMTARLMLGEIFLLGEHSGGTPDRRRAYDVLISAAESGHPRAQNMIGVILRDGGLGKSDPAAAREWFQKAALQGDAKACSNLGHLLGHDSNERAVRIEALKWLMVANDLNELTARYTLSDIKARCAVDELEAARKLANEVTPSLPRSR